MPSNGEIIVRKAQKADAHFAADMIYLSGVELSEYLYKTEIHSPIEFIRHAFVSGGGFFDYQRHWVATIDGELAGIIASWDDQAYDQMVEEEEILVRDFFDETDARGVFSRESHIDSLIPFFGANTIYIASVAVAPAHQRLGVGSRLVSHVLDLVKSQSISRVVLDVSAENPPAIRLYEKHGFVSTELNACSDPSAKMPDARRMVLEIASGNAS